MVCLNNFKLFNLSIEAYTGGARTKKLQVKIYGVNNFLDIIIVVINRGVKRTWYLSIVNKSKLSSTVSRIIESS